MFCLVGLMTFSARALRPEHLFCFWCLLTPELVLKPLPQCWHTKCLVSLCTESTWLFRPFLHLKARLHLSQGKGLSWKIGKCLLISYVMYCFLPQNGPSYVFLIEASTWIVSHKYGNCTPSYHCEPSCGQAYSVSGQNLFHKHHRPMASLRCELFCEAPTGSYWQIWQNKWLLTIQNLRIAFTFFHRIHTPRVYHHWDETVSCVLWHLTAWENFCHRCHTCMASPPCALSCGQSGLISSQSWHHTHHTWMAWSGCPHELSCHEDS